MIICKTIAALQSTLQPYRLQNNRIGFVPTMGALHNGHISLIEQSNQTADITVCSIFINPTQFNDSKDFEKYPVTIENDIFLLEKAKCQILFLPSVQEMYPHGTSISKHYNLGFVETNLEGKFRANHFQGVCMIVERLLRIVEPHYLFLGQKDYQQCMVIKKLIELMNWENKTELIIGKTLREASGLAMSSRNMRLSEEEKQKATVINQSLLFLKNNIANYRFENLIQKVTENLQNAGFTKIDYVAICNAENLQEVFSIEDNKKLVALIAAFAPNGVRLIDNMLLN